jgi:tricorn protease
MKQGDPMIRRVVCSLVAAIVLASTATAIEAPLPRHPAPSPDGSQIAFSWQGDLWLVPAEGGQAARLTAHPAVERFPVWSRDGSLIAFASNRHGNDDVFVMPADGSAAPTRLTYASTGDLPDDFTPDGQALLFTSSRAESVKWGTQLWTVSLDGGTPALAQDAFGEHAAYSPDGKSLVFVRGQTKWTRRGYRGYASRELWLRAHDGDYQKLTDFNGTDDHPMWIDDDSIAFLSSRAGRKNLFILETDSDDAAQLTTHEDSAVRFPRAAADGSIIAYEFEDGLWTVSPAGSEPTRLSLQVSHDDLRNEIVRKTERDGAEELALSPDGKLAAFVLDGDVFVTGISSKDDQEIAKEFTARVTTTPERERSLSWSPDGEKLLFSSAQHGNDDLYLAKRSDEETSWTESFDFDFTRLTTSPVDDFAAKFSPDGKNICFVRGRGALIVIPAEGGNETVLIDRWYEPGFDWSPDGKWIAYSTADDGFNYDVWIVSAVGGDAYNVSRHPSDDLVPQWSPDGRRLVWTAKRVGNTHDVWGVWLTREDDERTPAQWLKLWNDKPEDEKKMKENGDEGEEEKKPDLPTVKIEFDRLWERVVQITDLKGDEGAAQVSPDGKTIIFTAEHEGETDLYKVRWDGDELKRLTTEASPEQYVFDSKGKNVFYLNDDGGIKRVSLDGEEGDPVPFTARYQVNLRQRREVVFNEAWRALDLNFYDPKFHGVDWPAQRDKYLQWALAASTDEDFADIVNLMLGELNASHMGYYPPGTRGGAAASGDTTGWIGVTYAPTARGPGILIDEVLPDSPGWRTDAAIRSGERLLAVDGVEISDTTNVFGLFVDTVGERTRLTVKDRDGGERTVVVEPISYRAHRQLRYTEWVRERRRLVDEWSEGRLGYIHIQGMSIPSFEEFERGLYAAANGKEGLLIDVRSNGGGWTTDYLMAVLMVQRHAFTIPRGAEPDMRGYPTAERLPVTAWTRPAATLCNMDSYSNAEIFSHAFKSLGRGPLVGSPTFGAVISTGGMRTLDGALVRLPFRGWYVAPTGANMEKEGAMPDVVVWQPPTQDRSKTNDAQLERAVEVLLENLASDPRTGAW